MQVMQVMDTNVLQKFHNQVYMVDKKVIMLLVGPNRNQ